MALSRSAVRMLSRLGRGATLLSVAVLTFGAPVASQVVTDTAHVQISGRVVDVNTGKAVANALVRFVDTDFQARSGADGRFVLGSVLKGSYWLVVSAVGYQTRGGNLRVLRSGELTLALEPLGTVQEGDSLPRSLGGLSRVLGRVVEMETGKPVEGAEVRLGEGIPPLLTNPQGKFEFAQVRPGRLRLAVSFLGRAPVEDSVDVPSGTTTELNVRLAVDPVRLEPMVITATPRNPYLEEMGFYRRREMGYSRQQISRETIDERQPRHLGDLLSLVPGVRVDYGGAGGFQVRLRRVVRINETGTSGCVPQVYMDDLPVDIGWLENVRPDRVEAIEVYTGANAPLRYNNPCGVILLWTRRGQRGGG